MKRSRWGCGRSGRVRGTGEIPEGLSKVTVQILEEPIEHMVTMQAFKNWPARDGGSPSDRVARERVRG